MKEFTLLDTFEAEDQDTQDTFDCLKDDLIDDIENAVKAYEKQYHTSIGGFLQLSNRSSRYGSIGGNGLTSGRYVDSVADLFSSEDAMDLRVYLDEGGLHFDYYDHDGVNATALKFITDTVLDNQYNATDEHGFTYDQTIDYLLKKLKYTKGTNYKVFKKVLNIA
ncbi:hypothetical protein [Lactobacillus acetotolerans]|uniref:hypothetical protein n=1 Tax=Lactobacillus acetotolerans TaxID=1600 RepID=UPI002FD97DAF